MARAALRLDAVPNARHGGDDERLAEALAQGGNGDADGVGERVRVLVPGPFQKFLGADHTALGGHQYFEDGELLTGEPHVPAVAVDLTPERIQAQAGDLPHGRPVVPAPAVESPE